jgi:hypothetical protein
MAGRLWPLARVRWLRYLQAMKLHVGAISEAGAEAPGRASGAVLRWVGVDWQQMRTWLAVLRSIGWNVIPLGLWGGTRVAA